MNPRRNIPFGPGVCPAQKTRPPHHRPPGFGTTISTATRESPVWPDGLRAWAQWDPNPPPPMSKSRMSEAFPRVWEPGKHIFLSNRDHKTPIDQAVDVHLVTSDRRDRVPCKPTSASKRPAGVKRKRLGSTPTPAWVNGPVNKLACQLTTVDSNARPALKSAERTPNPRGERASKGMRPRFRIVNLLRIPVSFTSRICSTAQSMAKSPNHAL